MRLVGVILPDLGTAPEVPIVVSYWHARRGEEVLEGDRLVEIVVGPVTVDVPAPANGRLHQIRRDDDDRVTPGEVLGLLAVEDDGDGSAA